MNERALFCVYYAGLVAMKFHPRNADMFCQDDLLEAADIAETMVRITNERFPEDNLCHG